MTRYCILFVLLLLSAGCATVGPDFQKPETKLPAAFRHAGSQGGETEAQPTRLPSNWWRLFGDDRLNSLVESALTKSPSVSAAAARLAQAQALYRTGRAAQLPELDVNAGWANSRSSENTSQGIFLRRTAISGNQFFTGLSLSYEIDLWGKIRRAVEAADALALAARHDRDGVLLLLASQVATGYWQLRGIASEIQILEGALASRRETQQLVEARFAAGLTNELDISRARIETATAEADLHDARRQRYLLEHALAALCGEFPSDFQLVDEGGVGAPLPQPPSVPAGLPAAVLSRRPDLAASVEILHGANAGIGVAKAAFYPAFHLTADYGYASEKLHELLKGGSRQFSFGPLALSLPIFDGGRNRAGLDLARARHEEELALYQERLLNALREVEDALSDSEQREKQGRVQAQAQQAAARAFEVAVKRYEQGLANYLEVTDAQRSALAADRAVVRNSAQRLVAAVAVVRALGGGWQAQEVEDAVRNEPRVSE